MLKVFLKYGFENELIIKVGIILISFRLAGCFKFIDKSFF